MVFSVIASDRRERGNLVFSSAYEIASVVSLPRNDVMTQPHEKGGRKLSPSLS